MQYESVSWKIGLFIQTIWEMHLFIAVKDWSIVETGGLRKINGRRRHHWETRRWEDTEIEMWGKREWWRDIETERERERETEERERWLLLLLLLLCRCRSRPKTSEPQTYKWPKKSENPPNILNVLFSFQKSVPFNHWGWYTNKAAPVTWDHAQNNNNGRRFKRKKDFPSFQRRKKGCGWRDEWQTNTFDFNLGM